MWDPWPSKPPEWTLDSYNVLMESEYVQKMPKITLQQIIENSKKFPIEFPIETIKCETLLTSTPEDVLEKNINSVYPVVHEKVLNLYAQFLSYKRKFGTSIEKQLYKDMNLEMLVDRLLTKRALVFVGYHDKCMLMDGFGRVGNWEKIGKPEEKQPFVLNNCLSYDEIKLSALLSVSSYTEFINIGDRNNCGKIESNKNKIEQRGIIIGVIGARFEKAKVMEYQDIMVTKEQNIQENGYGTCLVPTVKGLFLNFYGELSLTFEEIKDQLENTIKFTQIRKDQYFNNMVYERRLSLSIDTLLIEANERAKTAGVMAFVHVVGFGLGVWKIAQHQEKIFMDTFARRIEFLSSTLMHIADICFSYIKETSCGKCKSGDTFPIEGHHNNGIRIHIFNRDPHEKLTNSCEGNLLIVSYAWDGNALPGNEFWLGQLAASGDPAAASSTQIAEIHNPHINPVVCAVNLRVATLTGLCTLAEYQDRVKREQNKV
ncbi:hypothetical protein NQ314_015045 [Rhamnusium bicolor]|uniref:Uncharacterized protein n=1 Tax=Rhamnusium bicolor TaxID=1586634 RepID=A0AAV8WZP1_9CUCU|nr:hypothetical protein NQ314_015045 [Rhamnusium bicolor]